MRRPTTPTRAAVRTLIVLLAFVTPRASTAAFPFAAPAPPAPPTPAHPAVARIIVPDRSAISYGTGTLVDVRDQYGLVITNWHVVRDGQAPPEVVFPNGFRSQARPLKLDSNWDLAALVIWRPPIEPVKVSRDPPRPGERLTICGYGHGDYRAVAGRCTQYFAPRPDYPHELVELDVEARQGDSGGPIFNDRGELAGVLFGAGRGTTMGSYGGRVHSFLASLAPDIGIEVQQPFQEMQQPQQLASLLPPQAVSTPAAAPDAAAAAAATPATAASIQPPVTDVRPPVESIARLAPIEPAQPAGRVLYRQHEEPVPRFEAPPEAWTRSVPSGRDGGSPFAGTRSTPSPLASLRPATPAERVTLRDLAGGTLMQQFLTLLAIMAGIAVILQLARLTSR